MGRKSSRKGGLTKTNPSAAVTVYGGPYRIPLSSQQARTETIQMTFVTAVTTNGAGVNGTVVANNPSVATDWSGASVLYDEFRVLSTDHKYVPVANMTYNATVSPAVMVQLFDRDSAGAIGSYSAAFNYESAKPTNSNESHQAGIKMSGIEDSGFQNIASPTATWWYKLYFQGGTVSTTYGYVFTVLLVQFRGRV